MFDAIRLCHFRWRKKKVESYIIPPTHFRKSDYSITDKSNVIETLPESVSIKSNVEIVEISEPQLAVENSIDIAIENIAINSKTIIYDISSEPKVSVFSLASIRAKKELLEAGKSIVKQEIHLPTEAFNETDMLLHWNKYAQRLGDKGYKIMESLLLINDPVLNGSNITLELPNQGSKIDFETEINGLLGYLKGHLHNHNITIEVIVNEKVSTKQAFTVQEKYNRLNEKNPNLDLLRKTFDLDL